MRIRSEQKIAGYPAVQIRQLMRETVGRSITIRYVREILGCSDSAAARVMVASKERVLLNRQSVIWSRQRKGAHSLWPLQLRHCAARRQHACDRRLRRPRADTERR